MYGNLDQAGPMPKVSRWMVDNTSSRVSLESSLILDKRVSGSLNSPPSLPTFL